MLQFAFSEVVIVICCGTTISNRQVYIKRLPKCRKGGKVLHLSHEINIGNPKGSDVVWRSKQFKSNILVPK